MVEQAHFLNDEQKQFKQKMMEDMIDAWNNNLTTCTTKFNAQLALDCIFSVLVMFNQEALVQIIKGANLKSHRKQIMKDLFYTIKEEVDKKLNKTFQ